MDNNQTTAAANDPKSFQLYTGKAPLALQIIGGLMWLGGLGMIIQGLPMLLIFGLGIIPILLGIFNIKYGSGIFKLQKKAFKGTLVIEGLALVAGIATFILNEFTMSSSTYLMIAYPVLVALVLYIYRKRFVN